MVVQYGKTEGCMKCLKFSSASVCQREGFSVCLSVSSELHNFLLPKLVCRCIIASPCQCPASLWNCAKQMMQLLLKQLQAEYLDVTSTKDFWWFGGSMSHTDIVEKGYFCVFFFFLTFGNIVCMKYLCTFKVQRTRQIEPLKNKQKTPLGIFCA